MISVNTNADNIVSNNTNFTDKLDQGIKDLQQTALDINKEGRQDKLARDLQSKETKNAFNKPPKVLMDSRKESDDGLSVI